MPIGSRTAFPAAEDIEAALTAMQIDPGIIAALATNQTIASVAASGQDEWERRTGWLPFIAGAASNRFYNRDCSNPQYLLLDSGIVGVPDPSTGLNAGVTVSFNVGTLASANWQVQNEGSAYILQDQNAPLRSKPYTRIYFPARFYSSGSLLRSFRVNAQFGYCTILPDNAWNAALQWALMLLAPDIGVSLTGGATSVKEDDVAETYGGAPFAATAEMWEKRWGRTVDNYRRVDVGI